MQRMQERFSKQEETSDSVYVMDGLTNLDKSLYDVSDPNFTQTHCIRFEIDRSKANNKENRPASGIKITDVDFWLEGNRHAKANQEELFLEDAKKY